MATQIKRCGDCGRLVPPDEAQVVADQMAVAMQPLAEFLNVPAQRFVDQVWASDMEILCAQCFNKHNANDPLRRWAERLAGDPSGHPAMFQFELISKGDNHVD